MKPRPSRTLVFSVLAVAVVLAGLAGLALGPVSLGWNDLWASLIREDTAAAGTDIILWQLRMPRVLGAILIGAILAQSGAALQGLFRNPLADPGLIGVSSGAAVGALTSLLIVETFFPEMADGLGKFQLPLFGLAGGWVAAVLVYRIGSLGGRVNVAGMLLAGIAINAFAGAVMGLLIFVADDQQLRSINFWMLGSLGHLSWDGLAFFGLLIGISLFGLHRLIRPLNALLLGEAEAYHLGVDVERVKKQAVFFIALGVGTAVSMAGLIGFIGLVVPHLIRLTLGPDHRGVVPGSMILGAAVLLFGDLGARTLAAPAEVPIGILTALLGTPFFLYLMISNRHGMGKL